MNKNKVFKRIYRGLKLTVAGLLLLSMTLIAFLGCDNKPANDEITAADWTLFDIPGITDDEIQAVEYLRTQYESFSFGILPGTEAFYSESGEIRGYAALFCQWLSRLFGINFYPELQQWNNLFPTLTTDFAGELTATQERTDELGFFFSSPIAERSAKYFRTIESQGRSEIIRTRPLRLAFLEGTTTAVAAIEKLEETSVPFEAVFINNYDTAYHLLINGEIDAFVEESVAEAAFDLLGNIVTEDFLPLIYEPVSLSTQNPQFRPIINIVNKALQHNADIYLRSLYDQGMSEYAQNKFFMRLNERELAYLRENTAVAYLAEFDNYPLSFFNDNENEWQGIAVDILKEISALTALTFEPVNEPNVIFSDLLTMLENGEGAMLSELIRNDVREGRFLWPSNHTMLDDYAIISLAATPNINVHRVMQMRVGIITSTAYADLFKLWFPNHPNVIEYDDTNAAYKGLEDDEVDLLMLSMRYLFAAANYLENPGFKANIVFDNTFGSLFGFNRNEAILCSIIDKAMAVIDIETISSQWMNKTFDYRSKIIEAQKPWLIGSIALLSVIIVLTLILYLRNRNIGKKLDRLVRQRTMELDASRQDLSAALREAETANNAKSVFLATMSHEIRTPMNAIMGVAQIVLQKEDLPKEYAAALEKIHNSGSSLLGIINDILDLSKIETGKLELAPVVYDIPSLINDTAQMNIVKIGSKEINFIVDADRTLPSKLYGDELRIKQILNNLLSNAIKYTDKGHVKLSINHSEEGRDVMLCIAVEDTGQGMKTKDQEKLFSEYLRFNVENNRSTEGTGLGLSIVRKLVEMMDGTINVQSKYGVGSTFTVTIKQKFVQCKEIGKEVSDNLRDFTFMGERQSLKLKIVREPMPYGKVLVVDDVETNLYVAHGFLAPYKLIIEMANSGFEALDLIKSGKTYDIIFMDHMMPQMDGIETAQKLRSLGYNGAIVALTANALTGSAKLFFENGFDGFIPKPVDIQNLNATLNTFIRDRHPNEAEKYKAHAVETSVASLVPAPEVNRKMLEIFRRDAEKALVTLRETSANGDIKLFTTTVHAMKSALANVGKSEMSQTALTLESAGLNGDAEFIAGNLDAFLESMESLIKTLITASQTDDAGVEDTVIDTEDFQNESHFDLAYLLEQLQVIKSACEAYDDAAAYAALDRLKEKPWRKETVAAIENIRDTLYLHSDFEAAAEQAKVEINKTEGNYETVFE